MATSLSVDLSHRLSFPEYRFPDHCDMDAPKKDDVSASSNDLSIIASRPEQMDRAKIASPRQCIDYQQGTRIGGPEVSKSFYHTMRA